MQKEFGHQENHTAETNDEKWELPEVCPMCATPLHGGSKCPNCEYEVPTQPAE